MLKKIAITVLIFFFPIKLIAFLLKILGCDVGKNVKIGFSILKIRENIFIEKNVKIGHFNFIEIDNLFLHTGSVIKNLNYIKGPFDLNLGKKCIIAKFNIITRLKCYWYKKSVLSLSYNTMITRGHKIDCSRSIFIGDNSIIAGSGSQLWTHGYHHEKTGAGRIRIDGEIYIGNNVYVGSRCVFNPSVKIADGISIGSNSSVSKSLMEPGLYVSQPLRFIELDIEIARKKLNKINDEKLIEEVYEKI